MHVGMAQQRLKEAQHIPVDFRLGLASKSIEAVPGDID
jgi:hypothetical protein